MRASGTGARRRARALVVDDSPDRIDHFLGRLGRRGVVVATSYADALAALRGFRFSLAFLDCDLGTGKTGSDLAYWLARRLPKCARPRVRIHSWSVRGAFGMAVTLRAAGFAVEVQPFPPACLENREDASSEPCAVIHLARFRLARRAADALVGIVHGSSILLRVAVEVAPDGEPTVVALVARRTPALVRALPRSIDGIAVVLRATEPKRKSP